VHACLISHLEGYALSAMALRGSPLTSRDAQAIRDPNHWVDDAEKTLKAIVLAGK
jgi:hypothetical protein